MKLITFYDISNLGITPAQCMEWVADSITHKADAILPPKISLHPDDEGSFCNFMPCIVPGTGEISRGGGY